MPDEPRDERDPFDSRFPDARPLRRIQAATAGLIGLAAVVTLLSDSRPAEVRWGTLVGLAALAIVVAVVLRRRKRPMEDDPPR
jgi:LPXTG-motif cell wall-anchored protein